MGRSLQFMGGEGPGIAYWMFQEKDEAHGKFQRVGLC